MQRKNLSTTAIAIAAVLGAYGGSIGRSERKPRKRVPTMVTASPEEIAAWNAKVQARKPRVSRSKLHRKVTSARQSKRARYLRHPSYAERHPTIAAHYSR